MMYMPIWILYWFPFFLPTNYILKLFLSYAALLISAKCLHIEEIAPEASFLKSWFFTIITELMGIGIFFSIETNLPTDFYYMHYTVFSVITFLITITLNFLLNFFITFKGIGSAKKQTASSVILLLFTAPYIFLLPHGSVF